MGGAKEGHFQGRVCLEGTQRFGVHGLVVLGEEHGLPIAKGLVLRKKLDADGAIGGHRRWLGTAGHGLTQCGVGGIQVGGELHAGHVQRFGRLVQPMAFPILGQHGLDVEVGE